MDSSKSPVPTAPTQEENSQPEPESDDFWELSEEYILFGTGKKYKFQAELLDYYEKMERNSSPIIIKKKIKLSKCWCNKKYQSRSSLIRHINDKHCRQKCFMCGPGVWFSDKPELYKHCEEVHNGMKFPCLKCPARFAKFAHFVKHKRSEHGKKSPPATA